MQIKLNETQRYIDYVISEYEMIGRTAYPNLKERLNFLISELEDFRKECNELSVKVNNYQKPDDSAVDTWKQLHLPLIKIAYEVDIHRINELSSYLASSSSDSYISSLLSTLHQEVGFTTVRPVVSLHQSHWFAVSRKFPDYALYNLPASIIYDIAELPLIFHEMGHVCFEIWSNSFRDPLFDVLHKFLLRKQKEILAISDATKRDSMRNNLNDLQIVLDIQLEELVCDIVGCLLGGLSFALSSALGLWSVSNNPFDNERIYPPVDVRMRVVQFVLEHLDIDSELSGIIIDNWQQVQNNYIPPYNYYWMYDDDYLKDLIIAVEEQLVDRGFSIYNHRSSAGIRKILNVGAELLANQHEDYQDWMYETISALKEQHQVS